MSKITTADKKFLEKQVKIVMNEVSDQERPSNNQLKRFFSQLYKSIKQSGKNAIRSIDKARYKDDRRQAIDSIDSNDSDIDFIKHFFNLFPKTCYKSSSYASHYQDAWTFEDPGTYCLSDRTKEIIDEWYKYNRQKSIKKLMKAETLDDRIDILTSLSNNFRMRFLGNWNRTPTLVSRERSAKIINILASDERFINNWREQWHGHDVSAVDCFICLFSFVDSLYFGEEQEPTARRIHRLGRITSKSGDWSTALSGGLEYIKNRKFIGKLRSSRTLRSKWSGFCLNVLFDPFGDKGLEYWIGKSDTWKNQGNLDFRAELVKDVMGWTARDYAARAAAVRGLNALVARGVGGSAASGAASLLARPVAGLLVVGLCIAAVEAFLWWDPFEWFSIRDELEEEFGKILGNLEKIQSMLSTPADSRSTNTEQIQKDFSNSIGIIAGLIHGKLAETMQQNTSSEFDNIEAKRAIAFEIQGHLSKISKLRNVSFDLKNLNQGDLDSSIKTVREFLSQTSKNGNKLKSLNKKVGREIGLGSGINAIQEMNESNTSQDLSHERYKKVIEKFYGVKIGDVDALARAREIRDGDQGGASLDRVISAIKNGTARQNEQAKSFESWWETLAGGDGGVETNPNITSEYTILHRSWVNNPNGLKSTRPYKLGGGEFKMLRSMTGAFAICGVGLGHSLVNTSFYYGSSGDSSKVWSRMKERSKVTINGDAVEVIDRGPEITRITAIINGDYQKSFKVEMDGIRKYVNWLVERINPNTEIETSPELKTEYQAANLLIHLYYKKELRKRLNLINMIVTKDEEYSSEMESLSRRLASISPEEQNTATHASLQSSLRVLGAKKIMLFEALARLK